MEPMSRRQFFSRRVLAQLWDKTSESLLQGVVAVQDAARQNELLQKDRPNEEEPEVVSDGRTVMPGYFSSPLYSYALLSEMPWDMLVEEAQKLGIPYQGRSKIEVVREIFLGTGGEEEGTP